MRATGIARKGYRITSHGLRKEFANRVYFELTGSGRRPKAGSRSTASWTVTRAFASVELRTCARVDRRGVFGSISCHAQCEAQGTRLH